VSLPLDLFSPSSYTPSPLAIANAIAAIAVIALGIGLLTRGRGHASSAYFFLLTLCSGGWLAGFALMYASRDASIALAWARIGLVFGAMAPAALFHFAVVLVDRQRQYRLAAAMFWSICAAVGVVNLGTSLLISDVQRFSWGFYPAGPPHVAWIALLLVAIVIASIHLFWRAYRGSEGMAKERARALITVFSVASLAMFDYLPLTGVDLQPIGHFAALAFAVIATSAIWRFDLGEITPAYAAGQILETMKSAVLVSDMGGKIRVVNRATERLLGHSSERLLQLHLREILPPSESLSTGQLLNSMGVLEHPMVWRSASGSIVDVLVASSFLRDDENRPLGVVYVASDFTERKRGEKALRQSEQRYRTLFELNPLPMWVYDFETLRFTDVNDACIRHYGYSREEFLKMSIADIRPTEELPAMTDALKEIAVRSGPGEFRHRKKDGTVIDVEITSFEFDSAGRRSRLAIARDVTERKRAEADLRSSEERYRELFENAHDLVYTHDLEGRVTSVNVAAERVIRYSREEILGKRMQEIVAPEHAERFREALAKLSGKETATSYEIDILARNGRRIPIELSTRLIHENGRPVGVQGIGRDLTERRASETRYRLLFERNLSGVYRTGTDGRIIECNESCARIFGYDSREEFLAADASDVYFDPADRLRVVQMLRQQGQISNFEQRLRRRDGSEVWVLENVNLLDGEVLEGAIIDITDRKRAEEKLEYQAYHDVLTSLPNRLLFRDRIAVALAHAKRRRRSAAVMFLDLDQFKLVNDTLGHTVGDRLLQAISTRIVSCVRAADTVARMGGDEFTILLSDLKDREGAEAVASKVLAAVRRPVVIDDHVLHVTTSIGMALFPADGSDAESLLKKADAAMYRAKDRGRDTFIWAAPAGLRGGEERLEDALRRALDSGEFVLEYQPIAETATGRITGAEARLRWRHPHHGVLYPSEFMSVAEETQLIFPIGEWVLRTACAQMKQWHDAGFGWLRLAVGVSLRQLQREDFAAVIHRILSETGLPAGTVEFCISETAAVRDTDLSASLLNRVREAGVRLALDEFGTASCTAVQLARLPLDAVKIDAGVIQDPSSPGAASVAAMVAMGRALRLRVAAAGVDSHTQLAVLKNESCAEVQGNVVSPSLHVAQFEHVLRNGLTGEIEARPSAGPRLTVD
jgi:diguanylate cyclase (GGDEF)-like protein/PAS domain S-box-containing protein